MSDAHTVPVPAPAVAAPSALDRLFRAAGVATLVALAATGGALALGMDAWRVPFVLAHLCALIALVPLGLALVAAALRAGYAERGTPLGAVRATIARFPAVSALVAIAFVSVAITLWQFDGVRGVRAASNAVTVLIVLTLVARYVRSGPVAR